MTQGRRVILRNKRMSDARKDYQWQRDPELAWLDAAPPLTCTFAEFLAGYTAEVQYPGPNRRAFAIDALDGEHIGNCVYYNIDHTEGETEVGIMIGNRDYWDKGYGTDALNALVDHIFGRTGLTRCYLKTLASNDRAQACFRNCHFTPCGYLDRDGYSFLLMDLHRDRWRLLQKAAEDTHTSGVT